MRLGLLLGTILSMLACSGPSDELESFVSAYVTSVRDDTEFYKTYAPDSSRSVIDISRSNMSADFEIVRWEDVGPGEYEFVLSFSNGATGVVAVVERKGEVELATLIVRPPQR